MAVLAITLTSGRAIAERADGSPQVNIPPSQAKAEQDQARWSDLEAQRRETDGDYEGAVQAEQQADRDLQEAERLRAAEHGTP